MASFPGMSEPSPGARAAVPDPPEDDTNARLDFKRVLAWTGLVLAGLGLAVPGVMVI